VPSRGLKALPVRKRSVAEPRGEFAAAGLSSPVTPLRARTRILQQGRIARKVHDFLADQIGTEIVQGVHPPGAVLPSEEALRQHYGVSRTALREAFRVLGAKGLIASRPKIGARVRPKIDWNMLDPDVLAWHLQVAPTEEFVGGLFQLRGMVEPQAAALAATFRDAERMARISTAYDDMGRFKDGSGDLIMADLQFHQAILEATGNYFVGAFGSLIHAALICTFELGWEGAATIQDHRLQQHKAVLDAIRDRDAVRARTCMETLLDDSAEDVRHALRVQQSADKAG